MKCLRKLKVDAFLFRIEGRDEYSLAVFAKFKQYTTNN